MDIGFHHHITGIIAGHSGFGKDDASIIVYGSE